MSKHRDRRALSRALAPSGTQWHRSRKPFVIAAPRERYLPSSPSHRSGPVDGSNSHRARRCFRHDREVHRPLISFLVHIVIADSIDDEATSSLMRQTRWQAMVPVSKPTATTEFLRSASRSIATGYRQRIAGGAPSSAKQSANVFERLDRCAVPKSSSRVGGDSNPREFLVDDSFSKIEANPGWRDQVKRRPSETGPQGVQRRQSCSTSVYEEAGNGVTGNERAGSLGQTGGGVSGCIPNR